MAEYIEKWSIVNRLIDIENEFQQYKPFHGFEHAMYRKICEAEIAIGKTQAADVSTVRHGRWIMKKTSAGASYTLCSHCNASMKYNDEYGTVVMNLKGANYCPNCGAKMDKVSE